MGFDLYWEERSGGDESADDPSYFRLNLWAMSDTREAMSELGLLSDAQRLPFLEAGEFGLDEAPAIFDEDGAPITYPEGTPESSFQRADALVRGHDTGGLIPFYKLATNDGWLITPDEIKRTLARLATDHPNLASAATLQIEVRSSFRAFLASYEGDGAASDAVSAPTEIELPWWGDWISWLRAAADHGGVRVW